MNQTLIPFFCYRTTGEKIEAACAFVRQTWRILLPALLCVLVPVALWQANVVIRLQPDIEEVGFFESLAGSRWLTVILPSLVAFVLSSTIIWTLMQRYLSHPQQLQGLKAPELLRSCALNLWRVVATTLITLLPVLLAGFIFAFLGPFLAVPLLLCVLMPLLVAAPAHLIGEVPLTKLPASINSVVIGAFFNGLALLGGLTLISLTLWWVAFLPSTLMEFAGQLLFDEDFTSDPNQAGRVLRFVLYTISCTVFYLAMTIWILAAGYHYSSVAQVEDDIALTHDIDNFEKF